MTIALRKSGFAGRRPTVAGPKFQRVKVKLLGRFMLPDETEHLCTVISMSPGDALLVSEEFAPEGSRIVAYIDEVGRIEGTVSVTGLGRFEVTLNNTAQRRDKLAAQLTWIANREPLGLAEQRGGDRRPPKTTIHKLTLADGTSIEVRVIDVSPTGARLATALRPEIGSWAMIGRVRGSVVRHTEDGIAILFANMLLDEGQL